MAPQEPNVAQSLLLQVPQRVSDDRSAIGHHVGIGLHALCHSLKFGFEAWRENYRRSSPQWIGSAVNDLGVINPVAFVEGFKREQFNVGALLAVSFLEVAEKHAIKILRFATYVIYSPILRGKGGIPASSHT